MLRYLTSGESHGKSLISILDGIPANIELNIDEINYELEKRQTCHRNERMHEIRLRREDHRHGDCGDLRRDTPDLLPEF